MALAAAGILLALIFIGFSLAQGLPADKIIGGLPDLFPGHQDKIAVIYLQGQMVGDKATEDTSGALANSGDIVRYLRKATDDPSIRAIVLRVNSPGGTPVAAEEIIDQINRTRAKKPVVISMGDMATSAAYFVSSQADRIVANPDTFTGSIGVIWVFRNKTKYYGDEGIDFYIAKSGNYKDLGSDWRGLSSGEKESVQGIINQSYSRFVQSVATGRHLPLDQVKQIADGRVITGYDAKNLGLVDQLGGLYDAVALAGDMAHVKGKPAIVYMNEAK